MVVIRLKSNSEAKDTLRKLKKMYKFTEELIDCFEDKIEEEEDDDENYRYEDDYEREHERPMTRRGGSSRRYRRSM